MRKAIILLLLACGLMTACHQTTDQQQPAWDDEKLARVMADMHLADAATNGTGGAEKDSLLQVYYQQILTMHAITKEQYETELRIRSQDFQWLQRINKRVEELLK